MGTSTDNKKNSLLERLSRHGQQHLLQFWDELDASQRAELEGQIDAIDLDLVARLHHDLVLHPKPVDATETLAPLRGQSWNAMEPSRQAALKDAGMKALQEGKAAAFLVAGGQGTRLGHAGPKGTFEIGLPSGKSLFQLQAERLLKLSRDCNKAVPWYIMTSRENHNETVDFFGSNAFFGLAPGDVCFFSQAELPLIDGEGKILLDQKDSISQGPNGNGGCFPALKASGALEDMRRRGVEWVFVYSVDNALTRVCDPDFLGFALESNLPAASKAVSKAGPSERVGVFCLRNYRPSVLEYSEMTPELCEQRDTKGELVYGSANIAIHLFRRDFLEANAQASLPYHVAHKKIAHVDAKGETVSPTSPNAYKFELFMFDLFPKAEGMAVLEVKREEEFAPVKNAEGADSPATARELTLALHRKWALASGFSPAELKDCSV